MGLVLYPPLDHENWCKRHGESSKSWTPWTNQVGHVGLDQDSDYCGPKINVQQRRGRLFDKPILWHNAIHQSKSVSLFQSLLDPLFNHNYERQWAPSLRADPFPHMASVSLLFSLHTIFLGHPNFGPPGYWWPPPGAHAHYLIHYMNSCTLHY